MDSIVVDEISSTVELFVAVAVVMVWALIKQGRARITQVVQCPIAIQIQRSSRETCLAFQI